MALVQGCLFLLLTFVSISSLWYCRRCRGVWHTLGRYTVPALASQPAVATIKPVHAIRSVTTQGDARTLPPKVKTFVDETVSLCQPDSVYICDGSESEYSSLLSQAQQDGLIKPLPKYENWYEYTWFIMVHNMFWPLNKHLKWCVNRWVIGFGISVIFCIDAIICHLDPCSQLYESICFRYSASDLACYLVHLSYILVDIVIM